MLAKSLLRCYLRSERIFSKGREGWKVWKDIVTLLDTLLTLKFWARSFIQSSGRFLLMTAVIVSVKYHLATRKHVSLLITLRRLWTIFFGSGTCGAEANMDQFTSRLQRCVGNLRQPQDYTNDDIKEFQIKIDGFSTAYVETFELTSKA